MTADDLRYLISEYLDVELLLDVTFQGKRIVVRDGDAQIIVLVTAAKTL